MPEEPYDLVRIHCPACGEPLTADYGHSRQTFHEGPLEIYSLLCPRCATNSTVVLNPGDLERGGASETSADWHREEKGHACPICAIHHTPQIKES